MPAPIINGRRYFENGRISDFRGLVVILTMTVDRVILHTVMHQSSTSTYIPNFIEIEETFCGLMDGCTDGHLKPTALGQLGGVNLKSQIWSPVWKWIEHILTGLDNRA